MSRNITLTSLAGKLRRDGADEESIYEALLKAEERHELPESECRAIAKSIAKKPVGPSSNGQDDRNGKWESPLQELAEKRGLSLDALRMMGATADGQEVRWPMRNGNGGIIGWRRRRGDGRPFGEGKADPKKALTNKGGRNGVLGVWPIPNGPVLICEGEIDAAAGLSACPDLAVIGTPGAQPGSHVIEQIAKLLTNREAILAPDAGEAGRDWQRRLVSALLRTGASLRTIDTGEVDLEKRLKAFPDRAAGLRELIENSVPINPSKTKNEDKATGKLAMPRIVSARELAKADFPSLKLVIADLIIEGLTILAGKPKRGKSWLALAWAVDVARGELALGNFKVDQGEVLYLALEDSERRMKARLFTLLNGKEPPEGLLFAHTWPSLDLRGLTLLEQWLEEHPKARLIVIDTMTRVKPPRDRNKDSYQADAECTAAIQSIALKHHVGIVAVTHRRKAGADDVMDTVTGTLGITGSADTIMVLDRETKSERARLWLTGRDLPERELELSLSDGRWTFIGEPESLKSPSESAEELLRTLLESGPMRERDIKSAAKEGNIKWPLIWNARKALGIKSKPDGFGGEWKWFPPGDWSPRSNAKNTLSLQETENKPVTLTERAESERDCATLATQSQSDGLNPRLNQSDREKTRQSSLDDECLRERLEERAAIMEFEGNLDLTTAERFAFAPSQIDPVRKRVL